MTKREIAALSCRVLAIVALISVIQASAFLLPLLYEAFNPAKFAVGAGSPIGYPTLSPLVALIYCSPLALLLLLAGFLWTQADYVARKIVGQRDENMTPIAVNQDAQHLAFSVLGAYVLTLALPRLAQLLVKGWNVGSQDATLRQDWTGFAPNLVYTLAEFALALCLLFGARGLASLLADVRHLGRDKGKSGEENSNGDVSLRPEN